MKQENVTSNTLKFITQDLVGDLLNFPIWWYSSGLKHRFLSLVKNIKEVERNLAILIWLKNILVPMYGYYDWISRIISFVMRLVMLIFKTIAFVFWLTLYLLVFLVYLILPIFVAYMFIMSF